MVHREAQKAERENRGMSDEAMIDIFKEMVSEANAKAAIERGYHAIDRTRSVLIWSYPYAYFLDPNSDLLRKFEVQQGNVELYQEKVAGLFERYRLQSLELVERFVQKLEENTTHLLEMAESHR